MADPSQSGAGKESSRGSPRVQVRFPVEYTGRGIQGRGYVRNISYTGALIEEADPLLITGGRLRMRFRFFDDSLPVEIPAVVARETPDGFAVRFVDVDPRLRSLLAMAISRIRARASEADDDEESSTLL